eukprot:jgi/Tetstr1/459319/TSEL_004714.t1
MSKREYVLFEHTYWGWWDYVASKEELWEQVGRLRDSHRDSEYFAVAFIQTGGPDGPCFPLDTPLLTHKDLMTTIAQASRRVGSKLMKGLFQDNEPDTIRFSIMRSDVGGTAPNQYRAYIPRGFVASVTNCVLSGMLHQVMYYDHAGGKRKSSWEDDGERKRDRTDITPTRPVKEFNRRVHAFTDLYKSESNQRAMERDGLNTRDLDKLAEICKATINVYTRIGSALHLRHRGSPAANVPCTFVFHFLMTRVDHVELIEPGQASEEFLPFLEGRFEVEYVDTERLRAIASKRDAETADDLVYIMGGNTAALTTNSSRIGMRPQDVILQAGITIIKHTDTEELKYRMSTNESHDHMRDLVKLYQKYNVRPMPEAADRRCYRTMWLADQVWGHSLNVDKLQGHEQFYTHDFRKFYAAAFSSVPNYEYFHGYPANPSFHEFSGPIGNSPGCKEYVFGRGRASVFKMHHINLDRMDPSLREALNDAGLFKNEYTTTYLCSPIVHWLQDHGAVWRADSVWITYCVTDTWYPNTEDGRELYDLMLQEKTYPVVIGLMQAGRKPIHDTRVITPNRAQARAMASMYRQEFTNEAAMRIAGLDRFVRGEEIVSSGRSREELKRLREEVQAALMDKKQQHTSNARTGNKRLRTAASAPGQRDIRSVFQAAARRLGRREEEEEEEPADGAPPDNVMYRQLSSDAYVEPNIVMPTCHEGLHDCDKPHTAYVTTTQYGNRGGYNYISTFQHAYCVTRMLQAVAAIQDKKCIAGYSLDAIHTTKSCDEDFALAGLVGDVPATMKPAEANVTADARAMSRDCILSNHEVDALAETIMEEVDSSLAPAPDTPAWSEERNHYQQINVVNGRPGTGKTTGFFRRHQGIDTRLPLRSSTLATPTNLLACDFGNKFKGAKTMTFHKAFHVPICGEMPKPADVYRYNHGKKNPKNNPWSSRKSGNDNIAYKQTIVIDEASQHTAENIQFATEVAQTNHLQLFIIADYDEETGDIYQMGPVENFPGQSIATKALVAMDPPLPHIRRQVVHRQSGDTELDALLEGIRNSTDSAGLRQLLECPWVPKISGAEWLRRLRPETDLSVTPLHRNIETVTDLALERMNDTDRFKVQLFQPMELDSRTPRPVWFNRFLVEMGVNPRTHKKAHKGMTATITKAEWEALFADDRFHSDRRDDNGEYPPTRRSALVYNNTNYSASKQSFANDKPNNKVNPMIACTAHTVQGREIGPEGVVYALIVRNSSNMGGWTEDFVMNSVYVTCTRVRRRDQLVVVNIEDLLL